MTGVPCQLVIISEDPDNLPIKDAFVIVKQLFIYGVEDVSLKGDKIFVKLSYSPNNKTLKKKFGYLPIRYMRIKIDNEEEFHVLEDICKRYRFNLLDDEVEEFERYQEKKQLVGINRPFLSPPPPRPPSHFGHSSLLPMTSSSTPTNSTAPPTNWATTSAESPAKKQKRKMTRTTTSQNPEEVLDLDELNIDHFLSQK
ncbi:uncharacterized protein LOC126890777 [Diabrotica virgifera virgifera]|uniref:Uncharacterized protein n=1 Tax=Diabrotica virgifera virgifera TaxID=50390 RepID=A0ABM5L0F6_DIAVI|nr:uncharacterized protein LOC126890777 [Diabrotica virgifera virgifera]